MGKGGIAVADQNLVEIRDDAKEQLRKMKIFLRRNDIRQVDFVSDAILSYIDDVKCENDVIVIEK